MGSSRRAGSLAGMSSDFSPPNAHLSLWGRSRVGISDYIAHLKLFNRNCWLYLLGSFLIGINFQVFLVLLNLFLKEIGFLESNIGIVGSSRAVGMTLMAIPAGMILSRLRLRPVLIVSSLLFAVFSFFIVSSRTIGLLVTFSILSGTAFSFYRIAAGPFFMRNSSSEERTYLFSFSFGTNLMAGIIGASAAGRMAAIIGERTGDMITGYQYTLYAGIAVSILAAIPFALLRSREPSSEERRIDITWARIKQRSGFYSKIFLCNFIIGAGAGLIIPFLNLYFRDRFNLQPDTIGLFYSLVHFSMLVGSLSGPVLAKRLGLVRTVVVTQLASIPFMGILSYTYLLPLAVVAFVMRGGLMNLGVPIVTNLGMELADKTEQGLVGALLMVGWTSSWMVSTAVGGALIERYGYTVTMNITIGLYLLSTLVFYAFFRHAEARREDAPGWSVTREAF